VDLDTPQITRFCRPRGRSTCRRSWSAGLLERLPRDRGSRHARRGLVPRPRGCSISSPALVRLRGCASELASAAQTDKARKMHQGPAGEGGWPGPDRPRSAGQRLDRDPAIGREHDCRVCSPQRPPGAGVTSRSRPDQKYFPGPDHRP